MDITTIEYLLAIIGTIIGTVGSLTWWLSTQFRSTRDLVYSSNQKVLDKLDYHEKHDDTRFQDVRNDIWAIRLRNATIDAVSSKRQKQLLELKEVNDVK